MGSPAMPTYYDDGPKSCFFNKILDRKKTTQSSFQLRSKIALWITTPQNRKKLDPAGIQYYILRDFEPITPPLQSVLTPEDNASPSEQLFRVFTRE